MFFLLATSAFAAPAPACERQFITPDLTDALGSAEYQFSEQDVDGFTGSEAVVSARLTCFSEPLAPEVLARIYVVKAIAAFLSGDKPHVATALAGMAAASPGYQIPSRLLPDGHPIRSAIGAAALLLRDAPTVELHHPEVGWIEVDGVNADTAPTNRDVVLQRFGSDGSVTETVYLRAGDSLAGWTAGPGERKVKTARPPAPVVAVPRAAKPAPKPAPIAKAAPVKPPPPASIVSPAPGSKHVPVAVRVSLAVAGGGLVGAPDGWPPAVLGGGGRGAGGVEFGTGTLGAFVEVGWLGVFDPSPNSREAQSITAAGGLQLRAGRVTVEAGPVWVQSFAKVSAVECSVAGCAADATVAATGEVSSAGGVLGADVRLGGTDSLFSLEAQAGAATDLLRPTIWGAVGVRFGKRWEGS